VLEELQEPKSSKSLAMIKVEKAMWSMLLLFIRGLGKRFPVKLG
jgi:hypothetical protein